MHLNKLFYLSINVIIFVRDMKNIKTINICILYFKVTCVTIVNAEDQYIES